METLPSIDHIRRPTLDARKRAEIHHHLAALTHALHLHDQHAIEWNQQRRHLFQRIQHAHDLLWDIDCLQGRQPARPGQPPLPPVCDNPIGLHGRRLRTTCLAILRTHGPLSLPELHSLIHLYGYAIQNHHPGKALADAMALEVRQGRARRPRRGHYAIDPRYRPLRRHRSTPPPLLNPIDPLLHWYPQRWWPNEPDAEDARPGSFRAIGGRVAVGDDLGINPSARSLRAARAGPPRHRPIVGGLGRRRGVTTSAKRCWVACSRP